MNANIKIIAIVIISVSIGVAIGYFIASKKSQVSITPDQHQHDMDKEQIYTCAMHPQIRKNEPGLCPICEMDLIPLEKNTSKNPLVLEMTNEAVKLANIQTTIVGQQAANSKTLQLSGKIKTDERRVSSQTAHIPGRVEKLYITFTGQQVKKGQTIATVYSPEFVAAQRELIEAKKLKSTNPSLFEAARKKLSHWKIPVSVIDSIERSEMVNTLIDIHADATGVADNLQIAVGEHLMEGEVLFDIVNLKKLWVVFDAYEEDLSHIQIGSKISFTTPAIPDRNFKTTVNFIDPLIDPKTRTASIRAEINNQNGILKPEMFIKGTVSGAKKTNDQQHFTIPKTAVLWTGKRSVVYVKVPETTVPSFEYREVEIGEALGDNYVILSGLNSGESVVTNGSFTIDAAAQLNNQNSMMNRKVDIRDEIIKSDDHVSGKNEILPQQAESDLKMQLKYYLKIKEALVNSDSIETAKIAHEIVDLIIKSDFHTLENGETPNWLEMMTSFFDHSKNIAATSDLESQRSEFHLLSMDLIQLLKMSNQLKDTLYIQHCPMANNDKGADWLSLDNEIMNPYYGDKMLKCGFIKDKIEP